MLVEETIAKAQPVPEISTVEEKIILEKQLPFNPKGKVGPTVDLFFHELITKKNLGQKVFQFFVGIILGIIFLITFPLIALFIKLFSREPVFRKVGVPGRRGMIFHQLRYSTDHSHKQQSFPFGTFLKKTKLEKLPSIINVWKGDMDLVGPCPYSAEWCNKWNKELSDFYKRFALKPGYIGAAPPVSDYDNTQEVAKVLKKELKYILNPTLKKDFCRVLGIR